MKNYVKKQRKLLNDKSGVFGLTSVQAFFAIILGVALLAYVIVVILSVLSTSSIISTYASNSVVNETGTINATGYTLAGASVAGFSSPAMVLVSNTTTGFIIPASNYTLSNAGVVTYGAGGINYTSVKFTYTYNDYSDSQNQLNSILTNTSSGVSSFFAAINPVYAILAILVIILVLVVLVRVVTGGTAGMGNSSAQGSDL